MLQAAIGRCKELWPEAALHVLATDSQALSAHCPEVIPIPINGYKRWAPAAVLPGWLFPGIPSDVRAHFPVARGRWWRMAGWLYPPDFLRVRQFAEALFTADLLVLSGCGLMTDAFQPAALRLLDVFDCAIKCGIPTIMLGQGIGPMKNKVLFERAAEVLPRVRAIFIRERLVSRPLLEGMGVGSEKIFETGDDAIAPAYQHRQTRSGTCLGVNLRIAGYSAIGDEILERMREVLMAKALQYQVGVVGIPITVFRKNSDVEILSRLVPRTQSNKPGDDLGTSAAVMRRTGDCRVVVAGSYHAAVFALAQGIPVVAIAGSDYYHAKFGGLAAEFGSGCIVLQASGADFSERLSTAVDRLWSAAGTHRSALLAAAERQMSAANDAYARVPELAQAKRKVFHSNGTTQRCS